MMTTLQGGSREPPTTTFMTPRKKTFLISSDGNGILSPLQSQPGKLVPLADTFADFLDNASTVFGVRCVDAYRKSGRPMEDINVLAASKVVFLTFEEDPADVEVQQAEMGRGGIIGQGVHASTSSAAAPRGVFTTPPLTAASTSASASASSAASARANHNYSAHSPFFEDVPFGRGDVKGGSGTNARAGSLDQRSDGSGSIALSHQFADVPMVSFLGVHDGASAASTTPRSTFSTPGPPARHASGGVDVEDIRMGDTNGRGGAALGMLTPLGKTPQRGTSGQGGGGGGVARGGGGGMERGEEQVVVLRRCVNQTSSSHGSFSSGGGRRHGKLVTTDEPSKLIVVSGDWNDFVRRALESFPGGEMQRLYTVSKSIDPTTNKRKWVKMETIQDILLAGSMANMVLVTAEPAAAPAQPPPAARTTTKATSAAAAAATGTGAAALGRSAAVAKAKAVPTTAKEHFKKITGEVIEEVGERRTGNGRGPLKEGSKWLTLIHDVVDNKRPYFEYTLMMSLISDAKQLCGMCLAPILAALVLVCIPLPQPDDCGSGKLASSWGFALGAISIFSASVSSFGIHWLGFYFFVKFTPLVRLAAVMGGFVLGPVFYIAIASAVGYPLPQTTLLMMVAVMAGTYAASLTRMPPKLKRKSSFNTHLSNSFVILAALIAVFLVNRLLVVNLAQKDVRSLLALSAIYPILVFRGTMDCTRIAEKYNKRSAPVVEAFFIYVSSVFQAILFLSIGAEISGWTVFFIINGMDIVCLLASGPLMALLDNKNKKLMKLEDANSEYALSQWSQDPLKLKPLLVKTYCEMSAKLMVLVLFNLVRSDATGNRAAFGFINGPSNQTFNDMVTFTVIELFLWAGMHYAVEAYLRLKRAQHSMADAKKALNGNLVMLTLTNVMITLMLFLWETCANS